jgi:hypothetical protein
MVRDEVMTENQITALSKVGKGYDFFAKTIRHALAVGVSPEKIIDFLDDPATQITNRVMRKIIEREVVVATQQPPAELETGDEADTVDQDRIVDDEDAPTVVIKDKDD